MRSRAQEPASFKSLLACRLPAGIQGASHIVRPLLISIALVAALTVPLTATDKADKVELSIDASKPGAKIDRNLFGQFAEHLGHGIYDGIWVGPDSHNSQHARHPQRRRRGAQGDQGAQRALARRLLRRRVSLAQGHRPRNDSATLNPNWGGVIEPNTFGTDEFMDFVDQIGAEAYLSVNVGSGTPQEAAEWLEYLTTAQPTTLAKERAANGHPAPYKSRLSSASATKAGTAAAT